MKTEYKEHEVSVGATWAKFAVAGLVVGLAISLLIYGLPS